MCNPNQFRACAAFCWSNQVAQVVRTAFFCQRWQRGSAPHVTLAVSGASTLVAMGEYSQYFTVPVRFELQQQQFYDQVSNVAGSPQIEVRRSKIRPQTPIARRYSTNDKQRQPLCVIRRSPPRQNRLRRPHRTLQVNGPHRPTSATFFKS
jgi:hypothetical protein